MWWKENWKTFLTMLFGFIISLYTMYLGSKPPNYSSALRGRFSPPTKFSRGQTGNEGVLNHIARVRKLV